MVLTCWSFMHCTCSFALAGIVYANPVSTVCDVCLFSLTNFAAISSFETKDSKVYGDPYFDLQFHFRIALQFTTAKRDARVCSMLKCRQGANSFEHAYILCIRCMSNLGQLSRYKLLVDIVQSSPLSSRSFPLQ